MPRYITDADLQGLLESDEELDTVIADTERQVRDQHEKGHGHVVFSGVPLVGDDQVLVNVNSSDGLPATVRLFPAGWNRNVDRLTNTMFVLDPVTGRLRTIIEADQLNRLRTSVPIAVGAKHLASPEARTLGILGSGEQARGTVRSITRALPGIERVRVWSPTPANREAFAAEQTALLGIEVEAVDTDEELVRGADVVMCAGRVAPHASPFDGRWLRPGATVLSMTGGVPSGLTEFARYVPTTRRPRPVAIGFLGDRGPRPLPDPDDVRALGDVLEHRHPARLHPEEIVIWELANIYLWDQVIAAWVDRWAQRTGAGIEVGG